MPTNSPIRIACLASGNVELIVPESTLLDPLPEGIVHNKNAGCGITELRQGDVTTLTVRLPRRDEVQFRPCSPSVRYAGSSVNIGLMARALGADVYTWLTLHNDQDGQGMFSLLDQVGVRVHNIECGATPTTVGVLHEGAPTTLLMRKPTANDCMLTDEVRHTIISGIKLARPRIIFTTSVSEVELQLVQDLLDRREQELFVFCPRISILGVPQLHDEVLRAMAMADAVFMNRREYRRLTDEGFDSDDDFNAEEHLPVIIAEIAPLIKDGRRRYFVVTCDTDGAYAVAHTNGNIEGIHGVEAAPDTMVKDTTGAGDAFALGMTLALDRGIPWRDAMKWGARLAATNVEGAGGWFAADEKNPNRITPAFFDLPTT